MLYASDVFRIVLRQHLRRRYWGVLLTISAGVAAYLIIAVLGVKIEDRIGQDVNLLGGVSIVQAMFREYQYPGAPAQAFAPAALAAARACPEVRAASLSMRGPCHVPMPLRRQYINLPVLGVDPMFWEVNALYAAEGRLLDDADKDACVCVIGGALAQTLFGQGPYLGRTVTLHNDNYTVVGIGAGTRMRAMREWCLIPLSTAMARGFWDARPNRLLLRLHSLGDIQTFAEALPKRIAMIQPVDYLEVQYAASELQKVQGIARNVRLLLYMGIVGALLLGGLGIWLGTFASVREQTREIGLKLAMGAERRDIVVQFLAEALCKAVFGGLLGVALGVAGISALAGTLGLAVDWKDVLFNVPLCLAVSTLMGVCGGVYPALCASRMDVVSALRYE